MATLFDTPESELEAAIHLLIIGPSKVGKTHYIVELVKDGHTVLYVDNDNGLNTLRAGLKNDPEAMKRVHYIGTRNIWTFVTTFFVRTLFQWNETQDDIFSAASAKDDDKVLQIHRKDIPKGVIIVLDSWTSVSLQLLQDSAKKNGVPFETFNDAGQQVFGDAKRRADVICMNIQSYPGHVIVLAHQEQYEILEKPKGVMKDIKQGDMRIKENITVPTSVSRPHGFNMPKFFNEVGYMRVDPMGTTSGGSGFKLDFRQQTDRVGGGTPMKDGDPNRDMRFSKVFAAPHPIPDGWIRTIPASILKEEAAALAEERRLKAEEAKAAKSAANPSAAKPALLGAGAVGNLLKR